MTAIAILIGNAAYTKLDDLPCCLEDLEAMRLLLEAVERYDEIAVLADADADTMRQSIRSALKTDGAVSEIFFYFSGHGGAVANDYFYCGTGFDNARPNETGISETDLHDLFREASPMLLVKVLDACESGTRLVKDVGSPPPFLQKGLNNVIVMASSLHDQDSFGGEILSRFTRGFCEAATRREEGQVLYADIVNTLRDDFLDDDAQTPYFIQQGTARELFTEDAAKLKGFRETFEDRWLDEDDVKLDVVEGDDATLPVAMPSLADRLAAAETRMATPASAKAQIDAILDGVITAIGDGVFPDLFTSETVEHSDFREPTAHDFVARVMAREPRRDRFVHAAVRLETPKRSPWESRFLALDMFNKDAVEIVDLDLNCTLDRVELKITLTPRFQSLQRFVLVLVCAPSLEICYVFEILTRHARSDWSSFAEEGEEIVRRWYKLGWEQDPTGVIGKIRDAFVEAVEAYIGGINDRLDPPK